MVKMAVTRGLQPSPFQETVTGNGLKGLYPVFGAAHGKSYDKSKEFQDLKKN